MSFISEGNYTCVCGKVFTNSQAFNGHKSGCKIHQQQKYGSLTKLDDRYKRVSKSCKEYAENKSKVLAEQKQQQWISEQHKCEKCGNIMTEKFGSGRFCSRACANSRSHSIETRKKISFSNIHSDACKQAQQRAKEQFIKESQIKRAQLIDQYYANPKYCKICNKLIPFDRCDCLTCSTACQHKASGGYRANSGNGKSGRYNGFYCASTYELAFVIYCLDHNIDIKPCKNAYDYEYKGKHRKYHPDFIINDTIIEIKGYWTELVDIKRQAVTDRPIKILYRSDLGPVFNYINEFYGKTVDKDIQDLYQ